MVTCGNCGYTFEVIEGSENTERQACPKCGSLDRIIQLSALMLATTLTPMSVKLTVDSAPPFSFGAIVTCQGETADGEIIKLVDPVYVQLIKEIERDPQIIYQIDARKWEELIAAAYDKAGFDEVILTPRSGDLGRDVIAIKLGFGSVKFIEQVKAYKPGHIVRADEVRALLGVLQGEQDASKAISTTTSTFAPKIRDDRFIRPFLPTRLELIDGEQLVKPLVGTT